MLQLCELAKRVFHSPTIREDLTAACEKHRLTPKQLIRAIVTRWNSLAMAIARGLELRAANDTILAMSKYTKGSSDLRRFRLSLAEWELLAQLYGVLEASIRAVISLLILTTSLQNFVKATERVSRSETALLHEVIPLIDFLTTRLENAIADRSLLKPVRMAAARGLRMLNKYYEKSDDSWLYRLALSK